MSDNPLKIFIGKTMLIPVTLSYDISNDVITSQIRAQRRSDSRKIADFIVTKISNSELLLVLDDSITTAITDTHGWWDIKRVSGGEPYPVIEDPVDVVFLQSVTE